MTEARDQLTSSTSSPENRQTPFEFLCKNVEHIASQYESFGHSQYIPASRARICLSVATSIRAANEGRFETLRKLLDDYQGEVETAFEEVGCQSAVSGSFSGTFLVRLASGSFVEDACRDLIEWSKSNAVGFVYPPQTEELQRQLRAGDGFESVRSMVLHPEEMAIFTSLVNGRAYGRKILSGLGAPANDAISFISEVPLGELPPSATDTMLRSADEFSLHHSYLCLPPNTPISNAQRLAVSLFIDSVDVLAARTYSVQGKQNNSDYRTTYALFMFWLWMSDNALDRFNSSLSNDRFVYDIMNMYAHTFRTCGERVDEMIRDMEARNQAGDYDHPTPIAQGVSEGQLTHKDAKAIRSELIGNVTRFLRVIVREMNRLGLHPAGLSSMFRHLDAHLVEKEQPRPTRYWEQMLMRLDSAGIELSFEFAREMSLLETISVTPDSHLEQTALRLIKYPYAVNDEAQAHDLVLQAVEEVCNLDNGGPGNADPNDFEWYTQVAHAGTIISPLLRLLDDHGDVYCILANDLVSLGKDILEGEGNPVAIEIARRYTSGTRAWEHLSKREMRMAMDQVGLEVCRDMIAKSNERWHSVHAIATTLRCSVSLIVDHVESVGASRGFNVDRSRLKAVLRATIDHMIRGVIYWMAGQNSWNAETPRYQLSLQTILRPIVEGKKSEAEASFRTFTRALFDSQYPSAVLVAEQ